MDIAKFLEISPPWGLKPCLYIIEHPYGGVFRCGASGSTLYADSDPVYGNEGKLTGLLSRVTMYHAFWYPFSNAKIVAALRVKSALVHENKDRVGKDFTGTTYNISRPTRTLVLTREKEFHSVLDQRGFRMNVKGERGLLVPTKRELFKPRRNSEDLIAGLRQIKGEELYLMSEGGIKSDDAYRGGSRHVRGAVQVHENFKRSVQDRNVKIPTLTIRLNKESVDQLRKSNKLQFEKLLSIMQSYDENTQTETVRMKRKDLEKMRDFATKSRRRSSRLAKEK